jgi:CRP/FNR family transcriptional regulator, nitrogen fixation regulation protein
MSMQTQIIEAAIRPPTRKPVRRSQGKSSRSGDGLDRLGTPGEFAAYQKIFKAGEPAEFLYKVESGCVRTYTDFDGGLRRIHAFYYPGEYFGLAAGDTHTVSADPVTDSSVRVIKRQSLMARAARDIAVVRLLLDITTKDLQRTQTHNLLLLKGAQDRVVSFLLDLRNRKQNGGEVCLPMSRRDIADHLGLTIETVSRTFTKLRNASAISMLTSRRFVLREGIAAFRE